MTNRVGLSSRENQNFPTTGRHPDRDWMDTKRIRPTWTGNEARNTMDSGIEFTENRYGPLPLQPGGRKRHAEDDTLLRAYADIPDSTRRMPWDGPHKRILFESEDPDSTVSGSDTQEARPGWPPGDMCADSTQYRGPFDDRDREGLRLISLMLQQRVLKLQRDLEEAKAESQYFRTKRLENPVVTPNRPRFTSTPVPRYAGGSNWDQYREVFEAIVCSNGWDEMTAALQLIAHLDGEALNEALLVPETQRIRPGVLLKTLSAHYASPGRLAKYKCQFERMTQPPRDDPAAFAIELETLAQKAFVDVDASVRIQLMHDIFIIGQEHHALRRHLDSVGPDTPISDIVDRCRVWESHEESNSRPMARHEPTGPRGVFQVTQQISNEHSRMSTEPDKTPSEFGILAKRLRQMVQQPVPENSEMIDIEQLLRRLLPVDTEIEETEQPTSEAEGVDDRVSGNVA